MPLPFTPLRVKSYPMVNLMATGSTQLMVSENAERMVLMFLHLEVVTLNGNLLTSPSFSLGTSAGASDILPATTPALGLLNGMNKLSQSSLLLAGAQSIPQGTPVWMNILAAALGPAALAVRPDLVGYYV